MAPLPPLREIIANYQLSARKSLGQNFLLDANLNDKIVSHSGPLNGHDILEIGPGPGGLTRSLVNAGARRVVVVEKDGRFIAPLRELASFMTNIVVVHGDALKTKGVEKRLRPPVRVIANLPFNVATKCLVNWLESEPWPPFWKSLTLMFQEDVARRIVAKPGDSAFGRLSVLSQWRTRARLVMRVPATAFVPQPKVNAAVVRIDHPRALNPDDPSIGELTQVTRLAFGQRRKMLRSSLKKVDAAIDDHLRSVGIDPCARPETLSTDQFCALARTLFRSPMK